MSALTGFTTSERIVRHAHLFCGLGAGAKGFNMAKARVGNVVARFVCTGGIDVDPGAIRNFDRLTGTKGTVMDLFSRDQFVSFHGHEPPADWKEATPADVRRALCGADGVRPDVVFLSAPCKGFSGLLSSKQSGTDKYQALNALTLRGVWLVCEAFKDGPIPVILFENVPRIMTRGRSLLDQISAILRSYTYNVAETVHDCGELGGLAQSRKRFLLIARQREIIPNFIYEPEKKRLRGVGEVIGKLPLPGDPVAGPMHRVPMLQWKTWLRLALVPAGRDWRALNELAVVDGVLRDFGIVPEQDLRDGALGVMGWGETSGVIVGNQRSPLHGRHSVADPRPPEGWHNEALGVRAWEDSARVVAGSSRPANGAHSVADPRPNDMRTGGFGVLGYDEASGTVAGESLPTNGRFAVADPRPGYGPDTHHNVLGVRHWDRPSGVVTGASHVTGAALSVADPRVDGHPKSVQLGVRAWGQTAACVKGDVSVGTGPYAVADPRHLGRPKFNNVFRVVAFDHAAPAVAGPGGPAGGAAVADPRMGDSDYTTTKYKITPWEGQSRAVIGASTTGDGAFAVQDPRPVAFRDGRGNWKGTEHYGVIGWDAAADPVTGSGKHDNGRNSVADPRECAAEPLFELPQPADRVVARIIATDGTWHRPFTTLDLAALQSIVDPEEAFYRDGDGTWRARMPFDLESRSDAEKREWIGNAVPSDSAAEVGSVIGEALLLAELGETFTLSSKAIWVSPARVALAVDTDQPAYRWDAN
jgi:site-specific DNA-cytosine methylase